MLFKNGGFMSLKKVDFSSMNAILDEVQDEELYNVIGGCGAAITYTPTFPTGPECPFH